jgi:hypothetical protein
VAKLVEEGAKKPVLTRPRFGKHCWAVLPRAGSLTCTVSG